MVPLALGSDTGGSIRQPAALCGIVGFKPTYGRVSRYGLLAFASSLDQIGPLALTVDDAALVFQVIGGADRRDATTASRNRCPTALAALTGDVKGLRIGVPRAFLGEGVDDDVLRRVRTRRCTTLAARGATLVDIELPHARLRHSGLLPDRHRRSLVEPRALRRRALRLSRAARRKTTALREMYERTRDQGFGAEVKRRIMLGTYVLSAGYYDAYYLKAQQVRTLLRQDYERAFERVDVVATPTTPTPAFTLGEKTSDPLQMYLNDIFTVSANLTGLPAISVPCGFSTSSAKLADRPAADRADVRRSHAAARGGCVSARHDVPYRGPASLSYGRLDGDRLRALRRVRAVLPGHQSRGADHHARLHSLPEHDAHRPAGLSVLPEFRRRARRDHRAADHLLGGPGVPRTRNRPRHAQHLAGGCRRGRDA